MEHQRGNNPVHQPKRRDSDGDVQIGLSVCHDDLYADGDQLGRVGHSHGHGYGKGAANHQ
jgi:hypothetical protein